MIKIPEDGEPIRMVVEELVEEVNANKRYEWLLEELIDQVSMIRRQIEDVRERVIDCEQSISLLEKSV